MRPYTVRDALARYPLTQLSTSNQYVAREVLILRLNHKESYNAANMMNHYYK